MKMMKTGLIWDEIFLKHETGLGHPECAARLQAIWDRLQDTQLIERCVRLPLRLATEEELVLIHSLDYVREIERLKGRTVRLDPDTVSSPKTYEAALTAVGSVLNAVDEVMSGRLNNAYALVRPPGHHAERERAMGFCIFNNVAIAAEYARKRHDAKRIFIMDYDVHHGNGTQWAFYERPDVYYCSIHRYPFYPGTGAETETGKGKGRGYTRNIPFSGGQGDAEYDTAFEKIVLPLIRDYKPDFVLLSAGYDAHRRDPLGGMNVSAAGFGRMTAGLVNAAQAVCNGKLIAVLEGGYDLQGLSESAEATLREMTDHQTS